MQLYKKELINRYDKLHLAFSNSHDGNIAFHVGKPPSDTFAAHKKLAKKLGYNLLNLNHMQQMHTNKVEVVKSCDNFYTKHSCDALITNKLNRPLMSMSADCASILLYDTKKHVIAAIHAGRAGAFLNIVASTISALKANYYTAPSDIVAIISPHIYGCCYEVNKDIAQEASKLGYSFSVTTKDSSYYLDIGSIIDYQLLQCGVQKESISHERVCTSCNSTELFSYRTDNRCGRFASIIWLE